ncbi:cytochrome c oxidase copper chaperone-like [Agrilus planipennis]|uniref:Cytochrome c oxidase copper chaperone n=1 Tax=Agrilus planipennis TaxID=224129 RepID=A0A1W4XS15_AGRPL|nr:cytochrome c oxidase copper chaperone [Agrilus planipennis]XP_025829598.1 cytochrome c oxidase copper chaperone-like [Agrilus planipennis]
MGNFNGKVDAAAVEIENSKATVTKPEEQPKKLKPCCACPETKKARDACIIENGEENCTHLIEAHKECMRKLGFNI